MELDLPPRERTIEFGKCVRCRSPSGKCRHFFVMDIMATTTCWMLVMSQEYDEGDEVSFQQQTPGNYSRRWGDVGVNTQDEAEAAPTPSCTGPLRQEHVFLCLIWAIAEK